MSKPKFTPGPWIADKPADGDIYRYVLNGNGRCGAYIAKLDLRKGDNPPDEQEANAHLIAAAPELYAELQNIANADPTKWDEDTRDQFQQWAQSRARAALAKLEESHD